MLRRIDLLCELDARLEPVEEAALHRELRNVVKLQKERKPLDDHSSWTEDLRLPTLLSNERATLRSSGAHMNMLKPAALARAVRPFRWMYVSAERGIW